MKFILPVQWFDGWKELDAELLPDIAPHLAHIATFALILDPVLNQWSVTNVETGTNICRSAKRTRAIDGASSILEAKTPRVIEWRYRVMAKKYPQLMVEIPSSATKERS